MFFFNGMWHGDHLWSAHRLLVRLDRGVCSWGAAETVMKKQFASSLTLSHHLHSLTCQTHWCISALKLAFLQVSSRHGSDFNNLFLQDLQVKRLCEWPSPLPVTQRGISGTQSGCANALPSKGRPSMYWSCDTGSDVSNFSMCTIARSW